MVKGNIVATMITATLFGFFVRAEIISSDTQKAGQNLGASQVVQVEFDEGKYNLQPGEADEIKNAINEAKKNGQIAEVKVLSWADQEYPAKGTKAPKSSVKLANNRADTIKTVMKNELGVKDVDTYNMAQRPNTIQELIKTNSAKVKAEMETSGAAPTKTEDTGLFGLKGKKSAALVLVYTK